VSGFVGLLVGYSSGHFNERAYHITGSMGIAVISFIISCSTLNTAARYLCWFLFASCAYAVNGVILGWASVVLFQSIEKKAISLSIINMVSRALLSGIVHLLIFSSSPMPPMYTHPTYGPSLMDRGTLLRMHRTLFWNWLHPLCVGDAGDTKEGK